MNKVQDIVAAFKKVKDSTYRRSGARMLMISDGWIVGSISGGCLEGDIFEHARS